LKKKAKEVAGFVSQISEEINRIGRSRREAMLAVGAIDEVKVLADAKDFIKRELNSEVQVFEEEDGGRYDPQRRSRLAKPNRPAIFIE
jgi:leucyl-tRNA synthetase